MIDGFDVGVFSQMRERDLRKEGICIGEGPYVVERMVQAGWRVVGILCSQGMAQRAKKISGGAPVAVRTEREMQTVSSLCVRPWRIHRTWVGFSGAPRRSGPKRSCLALNPPMNTPAELSGFPWVGCLPFLLSGSNRLPRPPPSFVIADTTWSPPWSIRARHQRQIFHGGERPPSSSAESTRASTAPGSMSVRRGLRYRCAPAPTRSTSPRPPESACSPISASGESRYNDDSR